MYEPVEINRKELTPFTAAAIEEEVVRPDSLTAWLPNVLHHTFAAPMVRCPLVYRYQPCL